MPSQCCAEDDDVARTYQTLVPGRLQLEDCTRCLLEAGLGIVHPTREQLESRVAVRLGRQNRLHAHPYQVILGEKAVLDDHIGNPDVMRHQIAHLREQAELETFPGQAGRHRRWNGGPARPGSIRGQFGRSLPRYSWVPETTICRSGSGWASSSSAAR
ncbi:Scr1 family TA system antitoxin-like transcriptional regulator [Kitasatospora sp. NPDC056783]|uniref:Scr1 family TA system antitoxin-like transcriptional regulator n=1 Tax=Kitasatospora sp. NPDC056783 TaxID=3345943 RepID=UPI0036CC1460